MTIVRTWKGVVRKAHESAYVDFLRETGLRDYAGTEGNLGVLCMTRDTAEGVEFTLVTFWRSIEAIKRFAGEDYTKARYYPEDDGFLLSKPERVEHYELFAATGFDYASVSADLPAEATLEAWEERLAKVARRLERLGPINLAAIDEFREQSARKEYLDAQLADLTEALTTLENAIRKIDRETRTRFKETFDKVNGGLKGMFPRLFGGGHAYLELTGDDLLSAGVTVMARPPGKRNSTIHLLSGGEKALTAVALVFAIFELNPAPFCLLDEVDAPLDDANVGRFCDLVREMSRRIQFVFVTHNKTTMEMARQLTGVTMNEPGVSRLVAVDVDEAVQLAAM